jgi:polysaccharide biosynthesis transport protein
MYSEARGSAPRVTLQSYADIFRRRKLAFLAVIVVVVATGVTISVRTRPVYQASAAFSVTEPVAPLELEAVSQSAGSETRASSPVAPESVAEQVQELNRPAFYSSLLTAARIRPRVDTPLPKVTTATEEESQAIQVLVAGPNGAEVARLANVVPELHVQRMDRARRQRIASAVSLVREELKKVERQVLTAERALIAYRGTDRTEDADARAEAGAKESVALEARLREAQVKRDGLQAQVRSLQARINAEPKETPQRTRTPNREYANLRSELSALELQRQRLLVDFRPASDEVQALDGQIQALKSRLENQTAFEVEEYSIPNPKRTTLEARLVDVEASLEASQVEVDALRRLTGVKGLGGRPASSAEWEMASARLSEEVNSARLLRAQLSRRIQSLNVTAGSLRPFEVDWIRRAGVPSRPTSPQKERDLLVTAVLALLLAIAVVFLLEYLDDRTYSPDDLGRITPLPALGNVPVMPANQSRNIALRADSAALESYRLVRSGISFAGIDAPVSRILVTSPVQGDGKTVNAVNLATAMALDGKRVILVDADLRRPSAQLVLGIPASPGLVDVMLGKVPLQEALQDTQTANLRVLCAGAAVPDPTEMLGSGAFRQLVEQIQTHAEVIVFDSPPCLYVADALILSALADGVILVVRSGHTRGMEITAAEALLTRARARILGVVYNQSRSGGTYYYRSGYGRDLALPASVRPYQGWANGNGHAAHHEESSETPANR